jgi:Uma2 family endonuclease
MNIAVAALPSETTMADISLLRFTVDEYQRMIDAGFLNDRRVELLEGWIIEKMPHNPPHDSAVTRLNKRLIRLLPDEWVVRNQSAVVAKDSQPEPDLAVVRGPEELYNVRHPSPKDAVLVIDVSDSRLIFDRTVKGPLYAQARIPTYWIVNLVNRRIEVYTVPRAGKSPVYRQRRDFTADESIPIVLDGNEIARIPVREILS